MQQGQPPVSNLPQVCGQVSRGRGAPGTTVYLAESLASRAGAFCVPVGALRVPAGAGLYSSRPSLLSVNPRRVRLGAAGELGCPGPPSGP